MSKFEKYLAYLNEQVQDYPKKDEVYEVFKKYGKVTSHIADEGKLLRVLVELGADEEKAKKDFFAIRDIFGRGFTTFLTNTKTYSVGIYVRNPEYKAPEKKELSAADKQRWAMYGGDPDKNPRGLGS